MTKTAKRQHKPAKDLTRLDWEDLLDASLRTGHDHGLKRQIHEEMLRRVRLGWRSEAFCPRRLWSNP